MEVTTVSRLNRFHRGHSPFSWDRHFRRLVSPFEYPSMILLIEHIHTSMVIYIRAYIYMQESLATTAETAPNPLPRGWASLNATAIPDCEAGRCRSAPTYKKHCRLKNSLTASPQPLSPPWSLAQISACELAACNRRTASTHCLNPRHRVRNCFRAQRGTAGVQRHPIGLGGLRLRPSGNHNHAVPVYIGIYMNFCIDLGIRVYNYREQWIKYSHNTTYG